MDRERRQYRRLAIRLPLELHPVESEPDCALRTVTLNVSTGGFYCEMDLMDDLPVPELASLLDIQLTVPPGDGYFPYEGRVSSVAEVVRREALSDHGTGDLSHQRLGIGARFRNPLKLAF